MIIFKKFVEAHMFLRMPCIEVLTSDINIKEFLLRLGQLGDNEMEGDMGLT